MKSGRKFRTMTFLAEHRETLDHFLEWEKTQEHRDLAKHLRDWFAEAKSLKYVVREETAHRTPSVARRGS